MPDSLVGTYWLPPAMALIGAALGSLASWAWVTKAGARSPQALVAQVKGLQAQLAASRNDLPEDARQAFNAWLSYEDQTRDALHRWHAGYEELRRQLEEAPGSGLTEQRYAVFLDGMTGGGKTTFAWRLLKPTISSAELLKRAATPQAMRSTPLPIAVEDGPKKSRILHSLVLYDTAGEKGGTLYNVFSSFASERGGQSSKGVVLFVWDCSKPEHENRDMFSRRATDIYSSDAARAVVSSIVCLFNKIDLVATDLVGDARERAVQAYISVNSEWLESDFKKHNLGFSHIRFVPGSMLSGAGLQECYGEILTRFELNRLVSRDIEVIGGEAGPTRRLTPNRSIDSTLVRT